MSEASEIPEGVHVPGWFRQYLEARTAAAGPANDPPPPPPPRAIAFSKICRDFRAMGGKDFKGTESFVEARNWLKETEDLFVIFEVDDRQKVQLAVWLLKDEASYWWEVTNAERPVETWMDFRTRFETKFLSQAERSLQLEKFLSLKQGSMTVKEYVNQFNQLARFGLDLVNTQHKKALHFVKGLNEPLHSLAMTHVPMGATYEKLVDMALLHEEDKGPKETKKEEPQNKKAGPKKETQKKDEKSEDKKGKKCFTCGSSTHLNKDCRKRKGACFNCGEMGHFTRDCPKRRGQGGQANTLEASG